MFYNPYLVIPLAAWAIAQTLKFALAAARGKLDFKYLYASGGMPSVHSAVVTSLATTALMVDGPNSSIFGFTAIFAAIVMYDSFGVRRASGEQAAALNMLMDSLNRDRIKLANPGVKLREILGHKPLEVAAGAVLGVVLGLLFNISKLTAQIDFLSAAPGRLEFRIYLVLFVILIIGGALTNIILARRFPKSKAIKRFRQSFFLKTQVIGWFGLVTSFGQYEKIVILSYRVWSLILVAVLLVWDGFLFQRYSRSLPEALAAEADEQRKRKWLIGSKTAKKKRK